MLRRASPVRRVPRWVALPGGLAVTLFIVAALAKRAGNGQAAGIAGAFAFFLFVWFVLAVVSARRGGEEADVDELRKQHPAAPWHWRPDWHA